MPLTIVGPATMTGVTGDGYRVEFMGRLRFLHLPAVRRIDH